MRNLRGWKIPLNQIERTVKYLEENLQIQRDFTFSYLQKNHKIITKTIIDQLFQGFGQADCVFIDNMGNINV
ncbi:MAG: hypothetical protein ACFFD2_11640 [Promethearchaeota archaeon]